jgi:hypothetical protein
MAKLFARGSAMLARHLAAAGGESVTVQRAGVGSFTCVPWTGNDLARASTPGSPAAARVEWSDCDFLLRAADFNFGAGSVVPQEGDRITRTIGGVTKVYDVRPPEGEPAWRYSDTAETILRIHTKQVS